MKKIGAVLLSTLVLALSLTSLMPLTAIAAAPVISSVEHSAIGESSAVISWVTDIDATTNVDYGTASGVYTSSAPTTTDTTADYKNHAVILTGLSANTTYYYIVKSNDGSDPDTVSTEKSFKTKAFTISGVTASSITATSAIITWNTNVNATANVEYGTDTSYGSSSPLPADTAADSTAHFVVISGLSPSTEYHYRVKSKDASDNEEMSEDMTFTTLGTTAPAISGVGPTGTLTTTTTVSILWTTDQKSTSQVEYGTASATHGSYEYTTSVISTMIKSHTMLLAGLTQDTTYYYRVISKNIYNNDEAVSIEYSFTTAADTSPPLISGVTASNITGTTAIIAWDTDESATSQVEYGETLAYGSTTPLDSTAVTSHIGSLIGLTPGVTYHYRVRSTDAYANEAISADYTFTTTSDTTAPAISGVTVSGITANTATIEWTTDEMSTSQVLYGLTTTYSSATILDPSLVYTHSVSISGLAPGTTYHFAVKSADASGNEVISADGTFTTVDAIPPTEPQNLSVTTAENDNTPTFTWDASTDNAGIASYQVRIDDGAWADVGNVLTYEHTTAISDGSHTFEVRAVDNTGNIGDAGSLPFNIDATPPTAPTNITRTTPDRDNTPAFTWDEATDATTAVARYQVSIDGSEFTNIGTTTNFTADALADGNHTFEVRAVDRAGNTGEAGSVNFLIDATPPSTPGNIMNTSSDSDSTPTFTWDAATDATSGVASYQVRIDEDSFTDVGNATTFTVGDDSSLSSGSHTFEVRAVDEAGNVGDAGSITFEVSKGAATWPIIVGIVVGVIVIVAVVFYFLGRRRAS